VGAKLIVSYDGTSNDDDALALGRLLAATGASLSLAYVRHSREFDPEREQLAQHDAERRLEQGAQWLGDEQTPRHVVFSASTGEGLEQLARAEGAATIVFGSDYRTPPGRAEPGNTAQHLLDGGPVAIAVAAAGLRTRADGPIASIGLLSAEDDAAQQTAASLAARLSAKLAPIGAGDVGLLVVGSQAAAPAGRVALSGATRSLLNGARGSVLVVPHGKPVLF